MPVINSHKLGAVEPLRHKLYAVSTALFHQSSSTLQLINILAVY